MLTKIDKVSTKTLARNYPHWIPWGVAAICSCAHFRGKIQRWCACAIARGSLGWLGCGLRHLLGRHVDAYAYADVNRLILATHKRTESKNVRASTLNTEQSRLVAKSSFMRMMDCVHRSADTTLRIPLAASCNSRGLGPVVACENGKSFEYWLIKAPDLDDRTNIVWLIYGPISEGGRRGGHS